MKEPKTIKQFSFTYAGTPDLDAENIGDCFGMDFDKADVEYRNVLNAIKAHVRNGDKGDRMECRMSDVLHDVLLNATDAALLGMIVSFIHDVIENESKKIAFRRAMLEVAKNDGTVGDLLDEIVEVESKLH